jgi:hypothetical protein
MRARHETMIGAAAVTLIVALGVGAAVWPVRDRATIEAPARADVAGPPRLSVAEIQLGRAIGLDKRIAVPADTFASEDTVYASVRTEGVAEHVALSARFKRGQDLVAEVSQGIAPEGAAVSEFNIWKPGGLPPGSYVVEILVDGVPAGARPFTVR